MLVNINQTGGVLLEFICLGFGESQTWALNQRSPAQRGIENPCTRRRLLHLLHSTPEQDGHLLL